LPESLTKNACGIFCVGVCGVLVVLAKVTLIGIILPIRGDSCKGENSKSREKWKKKTSRKGAEDKGNRDWGLRIRDKEKKT